MNKYDDDVVAGTDERGVRYFFAKDAINEFIGFELSVTDMQDVANTLACNLECITPDTLVEIDRSNFNDCFEDMRSDLQCQFAGSVDDRETLKEIVTAARTHIAHMLSYTIALLMFEHEECDRDESIALTQDSDLISVITESIPDSVVNQFIRSMVVTQTFSDPLVNQTARNAARVNNPNWARVVEYVNANLTTNPSVLDRMSQPM